MMVAELEDYTIAYANGVSRHVPVVLCVPSRRYENLAEWIDPSVDLRLLDWPRHRSPSNPRFLWELTRLVRRERPAVIHLLSHTVLWLNAAVPFWPAPVITTVHDVQIHPGDRETQTIPTWSSTLMVRQSDHLIVHGDGLKEAAVQHYRRKPETVHVLPHPSIQRYCSLAQSQGLSRRADDSTFRVLMFGRIFAYKGLQEFLRAETAIGDQIPNLSITIAGRGDDPWSFSQLMGDAARYDVRNRFIEDEEVAQLFLDCDVVALPYVEASQSGVLNLAAAFGKPVVATDVGELGTTVERNDLGLVVPPGNPEAFAEGLIRLSRDRALLHRLGDAARAWADGPNAPETVGATACELYGQIANRERAA
ncbi:MAG: glycosyltransferase family 4 protein [Pseudomonadota bacterium]